MGDLLVLLGRETGQSL